MRRKVNYGVLAFVLCLMCGSSVGIAINTIGLFFTPVSNDLGFLRGTFAMHSTLFNIALGISGMIVPRLLQRVKLKALMAFGVVLAVLSTVGMSFSTKIWMFFLFGFLRGIGDGFFCNVPITMVINQWYIKRNGTFTSLILCFGGVMGAIFSPILTSFINTFGWHYGYLMQAALIGLFALPAILYPFTLDPHDCGMKAYGEEESQDARTFTFEEKPFSYKSVTFISLCFLMLLICCITSLGQHFVGIAENLSFTSSVGAAMLSFAMVSNILMKLIMGAVSDKKGSFFSLMLMILFNLTALAILLMGSLFKLKLFLYGGSLLYGSCYAFCAVGLVLAAQLYCGRSNYAKAVGILNLICNIGAAAAMSLIGYAYDFTGSYNIVFYIGLAFDVIAIALLILLERIRRRQAPSAKAAGTK